MKTSSEMNYMSVNPLINIMDLSFLLLAGGSEQKINDLIRKLKNEKYVKYIY